MTQQTSGARDHGGYYGYRNASYRVLMARIARGMRVVDRTGNDLGNVEYVRMGDRQGPSPRGARGHASDGFLEELKRAAGALDNPFVQDALRKRLLQVGFFKVDGKGLLDSELYVAADTIADVTPDRVRLTVGKNQLV